MAPQRRLDRIAEAEVDTAKTGQAMAIFLAIVCVIASIVFFAQGNNIAGGALLGPPLLLLIGAFIPRIAGRK